MKSACYVAGADRLAQVWNDLILKQLDPAELQRGPVAAKRKRVPSPTDYFVLEGGSSIDALVVAQRLAAAARLPRGPTHITKYALIYLHS